MSLSSLQLDAFIQVARSKSFSQAAASLHMTQSALSQRILNLEDELKAALFVREPSGVRLTEIGEKLIRYCQAKEALEKEFLAEFQAPLNTHEVAGVVKIAGFSTWVRSMLLPQLGKFRRANPRAQIEVLTREVHELPGLLRSGRVDFIFFTNSIERQEFENRLVGYEENVLIEPVIKNADFKSAKNHVYLDHDEFDSTTADFWKLQKSHPPTYSRAYFDEIYTIIDAVGEGFGRAVVPRHLVMENKKISIVRGLKSLQVSIYLVYLKQPFYTRLQSALIKLLSADSGVNKA